MAAGDLDRAVALYVAADGVLSKYGHVASLRDIHADARRVVGGLKTTILEGFDENSLAKEGEHLAARARLVAKIGDERDVERATSGAVACAGRFLRNVLEEQRIALADAKTPLQARVTALADAFAAPRERLLKQLAALDAVDVAPLAADLTDRYLHAVEGAARAATDFPQTDDDDAASRHADVELPGGNKTSRRLRDAFLSIPAKFWRSSTSTRAVGFSTALAR